MKKLFITLFLTTILSSQVLAQNFYCAQYNKLIKLTTNTVIHALHCQNDERVVVDMLRIMDPLSLCQDKMFSEEEEGEHVCGQIAGFLHSKAHLIPKVWECETERAIENLKNSCYDFLQFGNEEEEE